MACVSYSLRIWIFILRYMYMYIYQGADLIIALTHMRWPNDRLLAERVPGLDIILAGHDHDYGLEIVSIICRSSGIIDFIHHYFLMVKGKKDWKIHWNNLIFLCFFNFFFEKVYGFNIYSFNRISALFNLSSQLIAIIYWENDLKNYSFIIIKRERMKKGEVKVIWSSCLKITKCCIFHSLGQRYQYCQKWNRFPQS